MTTPRKTRASVNSIDLLSPFGEAAVLIDSKRLAIQTQGAIATMFGQDDVIGKRVFDDPHSGIYWAIEAHLENYLSAAFVPTAVACEPNTIVRLAPLPNHRIAIQLRPASEAHTADLLASRLYYALRSVTGFTDVILKGIDGPLTDIQIEDLAVISDSGERAWELLNDWRMSRLRPLLVAPMPVLARDLLLLPPDDLPRRALMRQHINLTIDIPEKIAVYSNGTIRLALSDLLKILTLLTAQYSHIGVKTTLIDSVLQVHVTFRPADDLAVRGSIRPVDLYSTTTIGRPDKLLMAVSSMHARLAPYGCSAWAEAQPDSVTITMTVPCWQGPLPPA